MCNVGHQKELENKIHELAELWIKWNIHQVSGNEFASKFGELFNDESMAEWYEYCDKNIKETKEKLSDIKKV